MTTESSPLNEYRLADESGGAATVYFASDADAIEDARDPDTWSTGDETKTTVWGWTLFRVDDGKQIEIESGTTVVPPNEPKCTADEHDWQTPVSVVGGLAENPGVFGHGGGVIMTEVCAHCARYRDTDTFADDGRGGILGEDEVSYREADENSKAWIEPGYYVGTGAMGDGTQVFASVEDALADARDPEGWEPDWDVTDADEVVFDWYVVCVTPGSREIVERGQTVVERETAASA